MSNLIDKSLGKYHILTRLGRGGMADVYQAYQPRLDRYVAVKVLHSQLAEDADFVDRFEREPAMVARLRHPNIVQVYDFDVEGEQYYMVMELVGGPTLKAELEARSLGEQPFSLAETVQLFTALGSAIDYAHARDMVHHDLKPGNIMFTADGQVVLTDFGLARIVGAGHHTATGAVYGTPGYISPEQAQGERGDGRSDIYALGLILYELVTGRRPFEADTPFALLMQHIKEPVPPPRSLNSDLPEAVEEVILKTLSKDPDDRFQRAEDLARALRAAVGLTAEETLTILSTIAPPPQIEEVAVTPTPERSTPTTPPLCPYRGLYTFREEDAPFFFGREAFTEQLVAAVDRQALVAVIGPSGSGKSSVVFAGLVAQLRPGLSRDAGGQGGKGAEEQGSSGAGGQGSSGESRNTQPEIQNRGWRIASFRPGNRPFQTLAAALLPLLEPEMSETDRLVETRKLAEALGQGDVSLYEVVDRIVQKDSHQPGQAAGADRPGPRALVAPRQAGLVQNNSIQEGDQTNRLLLVADQFEELYTLCPEPDIRHRFLEALLEVVDIQQFRSNPAFTLVLTLRVDFLGQALTHRPLADALQDADVKLGPMSRPELERAITNPARRQGVKFESGLVTRILDDVSDEPGNLPLLEFALTTLWDRIATGRLSHRAYEDIGRVAGALARYADEVYQGLNPTEQKNTRRIFIQMVRPGEGTEDTRRLATRSELGEADWELVQKLADARLVVTGQNPLGQETVEVVHEALLRGWRRLRVWMAADRAFRVWQERLRAALRQ
jgi:serine/threonine protein kinase